MCPNCSNGKRGGWGGGGDTYLCVCVLRSMKLEPVWVGALLYLCNFGKWCHLSTCTVLTKPHWMYVACSVLQSLYESIKTEPFKIPEDDGNDLMHTFFNPDKEGWLWKQGKLCSQDNLYFLWHKACTTESASRMFAGEGVAVCKKIKRGI